MTRAAYLRPSPGAAFGGTRHALRPGIAGSSGPELAALRTPHLRLLCADEPLVFDADACSFEGRTLACAQDFWSMIRADGLARVRGAFVLAWRERAPDGSVRVTLARDPIGHRTLYYTLHDRQLVFASSLYALQRVRKTLQIDVRAVAAFLSCAYVPGRRTLVEGVFELLPGELVVFAGGALERRCFWQLPAEPTSFPDERVLQDSLRASLEAELQPLLPADGRIAASLSGGIDSSLVVALAARARPGSVQTYSIHFGERYANELAFSSLVAEHCGTEHHIVELTPSTVLAHLDDTMACLDKPNGDPLTVPNALLFRCMSEHARVALNGEGGDPCFGGPKNQPMILAELYSEPDASTREQSYLRAHAKCYDDLAELLTADVLAHVAEHELEAELGRWFADPRFHTLVGRLLAINVTWKGGHHILPKIDALSAPFGVLPRSLLFSKGIVENAFGVPSGLKLHGSVEKYLLKRAVADLLPQSILDRPKSGMLVPVEAWFQGPLLASAKARLLDGLASHGLFQRSKLEELTQLRTIGLRPRRGVKLWLLVTLESHLRALSAM